MKRSLLLLPLLSIAAAPAQTPDFDSLFRNQPAFEEHWDTRNLFAYRGGAQDDIPQGVTLELTDSLGRGFCAPVVGRVFSHYGIRGRRRHQGTDIRVALGQPIFAAWDGVVRYSGWNSGGFGHIVIIRHASGLESYYAHLSKRSVEVGRLVEAGEVIGLGGRTGRASALHLHFEVRWRDRSFDAERLIDFETGALRAHTFTLNREHFGSRSRMVDEPTAVPLDTALMAITSAVSVSAAASESVRRGTPALAPRESLSVIPSGQSDEGSPPAGGSVYHTIRSGDTLWGLARRHGTTVVAICDLNGISKATKLRIGRKLQIK